MALFTSVVSPDPGSSEILWAGSQVQSTAYPDSYPKELEKTMGSGMGTREDSGKRQAGHSGPTGLFQNRLGLLVSRPLAVVSIPQDCREGDWLKWAHP